MSARFARKSVIDAFACDGMSSAEAAIAAASLSLRVTLTRLRRIAAARQSRPI